MKSGYRLDLSSIALCSGLGRHLGAFCGEQSTAAAGASERLAKRVKGLLNRLAEANVQPTVEEAAGLLQSEGRRPAMQALTQELLQV